MGVVACACALVCAGQGLRNVCVLCIRVYVLSLSLACLSSLSVETLATYNYCVQAHMRGPYAVQTMHLTRD